MPTYDKDKPKALASQLTGRRALQLALVYYPEHGHRPGGPADQEDTSWHVNAVAALNGMNQWERANFFYLLRDSVERAMQRLIDAHKKIARDNDAAQKER